MEILNSRKMLLCLILMLAIILFSEENREPVMHRVGGGQNTWKPYVNFIEWASHEQFYVGDWLYFGFNKSCCNVLEVNKTSYDRCIDKYFIMNVTKGGRDVFNLTEAKPYYFLSSGGYCFKGMRLAVYVHYPPPDTMPSMTKNGSPSSTCFKIIVLPVFATVVVVAWSLLF